MIINDNKYIDIKVAVAGNVDGGKTTLIGTLISGQKDNGRGLTRSSVFNFIHELKTGRTSSISHQILGFDYEGKVVNYQGINKLSWPEIVQKSAKIISFFDLCGHEKYLKTTMLGLSSSFPDICIILVDANNGIKPMTKEHIFLCVTLKIPFIIVISKIDICKDRKNVLDETIKSINKFLKYPGIRRIPFYIKNKDDIILATKNIYSESITPIFYTSCVTEEGLEELKLFLNILNKYSVKNEDKSIDKVEFHIDQVFNVHGFGTVVGGHLINGIINVGDKLLIGPNNGEYEQVNIRSIYCKKIPLQKITYGSYVCLGIKKYDKIIRKGNVIISKNNDKIIVSKFITKVNVLKSNNTSVKVGYEPVFHAYAIRTVVKLIDIKDKKNFRNDNFEDDSILRNNDSAIVTFEFKYRPQYLKKGTRFILAEGKTKVVGEVIGIC